MNYRYICILLIICIFVTSGILFSACSLKKKTKIIIQHESKYSQLLKKQKNEQNDNIINLGDDTNINFNYAIGPDEIKSPDFNIININMP